MIDWHDCIVPACFTRNDVCVWVAYQKSNPHLPVAIARTAEELAKKVGVSTSTVLTCWNKYQRGILKKTRYHRVKVGVDRVVYTKN